MREESLIVAVLLFFRLVVEQINGDVAKTVDVDGSSDVLLEK